MSSQDVGPSIREGSAVLVGANVLGEAGEAGTDLYPEGEEPVKDSGKHSMLRFFFPVTPWSAALMGDPGSASLLS